MKMNKSQLNILSLIAGSALIIFSFQNCGEVQFSGGSAPSEKVGTTGGPGDPGITPPAPGVTPPVAVVTPPVMPPVCLAGEILVNGACIVATTYFTECFEFRELNVDVIPSLSAGMGVCYYKKLLDGLPNQPSGTGFPNRALDVLAKDHKGGSGTVPNNPYVLGDASVNLTFLAARAMSLTSSPVGNVADIVSHPLQIDNFILVEAEDIILAKRMLARGTADAEPYVTASTPEGKIRVNGVPVTNFISYKAGGTAVVPVVPLVDELELSLNVPTQLRFRMLDCGGAAQATDMYLIIH